jgi:TorA maturation chaperone TorD
VTALADGSLGEGLLLAVSALECGVSTYGPALAVLDQAHRWAACCGPAAALEALATEHARLFTGPGRPTVMCYASQYLDRDEHGPGRLNGAAAAYAAAAYQTEGVALADGPRELPDHALIELEFLYHLCRRTELAWERADGAEAVRLQGVLDRFLDQHAGLWLGEFAAVVASAARLELYRALAELLASHLAAECSQRGQPAAG